MRDARWAKWSAWAIATVVAVAFLVWASLGFARGTARVPGLTPQTWLDVVIQVPFLMFPIVGAVIVTQQPRNPTGWLLIAVGSCGILGNALNEYAVAALVLHRRLPAGEVAAWLSSWVWAPTSASAPLVILVFPDGHFLSRRWRWVGVAAVVNLLAVAGIQMFAFYPGLSAVPNPLAVPALSAIGRTIGSGFVAGTAVLVVAAVVSCFLRYRRASGDVRQQMKWVLFSMSLLPPFFIVSALTPAQGAPTSQVILEGVLNFVATLATPVCIGMAILKYRLYDIDVVISRTLVYGALAAFITAVYVGIVVGIGTLVGSGGRPNLGLSIVATAIVAVGFQPVRERLQKVANRLVYGRRATPYEVLSDFSERVAESYAADDVLPRMARVLADGTGAEKAAVWLRAGTELRTAAVFPVGTDGLASVPLTGQLLPSVPGADRTVPVRHQGELLGALSVSKRRGESLTPIEEKLLDDLAHQAGLVLKNVGLTADLQARLQDLRESRKRLVAAQDQERRRLERNLHDGAQQHLVALKVKLGLAEMLADRDPEKARATLAELKADADEALETLRDLARGIYPPLLADKGLAAALEAQARKATLPVTVQAEGIGRYPQEVEAAVYFCVLEALQNVQKYAAATHATVRLADREGELRVEVEDDGQGFDPATAKRGAGLTNMADRLDALGGALAVDSALGRGTTVRAALSITASKPVLVAG